MTLHTQSGPARSRAPFSIRVPLVALLGRRDYATASFDLRDVRAEAPGPRHRSPGDVGHGPDPLTDYLSPHRLADVPEPLMVETCNFFAVPVPRPGSTLDDFPENTPTQLIDISALIAEQDGGEATDR